MWTANKVAGGGAWSRVTLVLTVVSLLVPWVTSLPRQELAQQAGSNNNLGLNVGSSSISSSGARAEPLRDPELRRTLLRVFAESLRAAAEAGARQSSNLEIQRELVRDLTSESRGLPLDQQAEELLEVSGETRSSDDNIKEGGFKIDLSTNPSPAPLSTVSTVDVKTPSAATQLDITSIVPETSTEGITTTLLPQTEASPKQPPAEPTFPGPSPSPPTPTRVAVTVDAAVTGSNLSPSDTADVQRFVSAVSTSGTTDETLGDGVELFRAPLIAAFALQQDGNTGLTRSLVSLPVAKSLTEDELKKERHTLSVAGQVVGIENRGIVRQPQNSFNLQQSVSVPVPQFNSAFSTQSFNSPQKFNSFTNFNNQPQFRQQNQFSASPQFQSSVIDVQRSVQPQRSFNQLEGVIFNDIIEPQNQLQRLERRHQELQQQLLNLQRERSAILHQRNTRSEVLASSETNFPSIPIYLQPPFF